MLQDPRGTVDDVGRGVRGLVHDDDAKRRADEVPAHHQVLGHQRSSRHLPAWAVPVGAAALVLAVVGGGAALASLGGRDGTPADAGRGSATGPGSTSGRGSGPATATDAGDDGAAAATRFSGSTRFNFDAPNGVGTASVVVTCTPGCTVTVDNVTGHNDAVRRWVVAALAHSYTGSGRRWTVVGESVTSCAQVAADDFWEDPSLWSAKMILTDEGVNISASLPGFEGPSCRYTRTELTFKGTPS